MFNYKFTAQVEKHLVIETVWEVQFTDEDFHINLNQEQSSMKNVLSVQGGEGWVGGGGALKKGTRLV